MICLYQLYLLHKQAAKESTSLGICPVLPELPLLTHPQNRDIDELHVVAHTELIS